MSQYIQNLLQKRLDLIPSDFNYITYLNLNPDLKQNGILTEENAVRHYIVHGKKEHRLYKYEKLYDGTIDSDFDSEFYLSEYPDVASYCHGMSNVEEKEKLFHHYIHYGKYEGRFKNRHEQEKSFINIDKQISDIINFKDLKCPTNILECVCLLTTNKEINGPQYQKFIDRLIVNTKKNKITKQIDFKIITNKKLKTNLDLSKLQNIFANVELINLDLPNKDDIYISCLSADQELPKYGLKSGPNIAFLNTIKKMYTYNTTLLLETDCFLKHNWINDIYHYVKYVNGFLVSGALYDGTVFTKAGSPMMNHINGGTALYATGNEVLQKTIDLLFIYLEKQVQNNMPGLAYDYAFKLMIDSNINNSYKKIEQRKIWQFINRHYLPCKLIINCSTPIDKHLDKNELMIKYNYSILHQKDNHD